MWRKGGGMIRSMFLAAAALFLAGCSLATDARLPGLDLNQPAAAPVALPDGERFPLLPPSTERGADIYAEKCAACHGDGGTGDGARASIIREQGRNVANLVNPALRRAVKPRDWHSVITVGRIQNLMPGFSGSLNAQQRWDVQAYVWALGVPATVQSTAQADYQRSCASCHGPAGEGSATGPTLSRPEWHADTSLLEISSKMAAGEAHAPLQLSDQLRADLADVVRGFGFVYASPDALRERLTRGDGAVRFNFVNGTPGGSAGAGLPVTLRALGENGEVFSRTATIADNGVVSFDNLPQRNDYFYQAELEFKGGRFFGPPTQIPTTTQVVSDILPVFEPTTDASGITLGNLLFAVQNVSEGELTIVEIYEFELTGDRAYIGENRRTLRISAPKDAKNVRFDGLGFGARFVQDGDLIYDTDVVAPGSPAQRITLIYEWPYTPGKRFERTVFYPVKQWNVFMPDNAGFAGEALAAQGSQLKDEGVRDAGGTRIRLFSGQPVAGNTPTFGFDITGRPLAQPRAGSDNTALGLALIGLAIAVVAAGLAFSRVRAMRQRLKMPHQTRQTLLKAIAELDEQYAAGKLRAQDYTEQRQQLKRDLLDVWQ
jgi:mono/diheme cytochrome c family protein